MNMKTNIELNGHELMQQRHFMLNNTQHMLRVNKQHLQKKK